MSCIAGGGIYHQPYLVDKVLNNDGSVFEVRQHQEPYALGVSQKTLELIKQGLMGVAQPGGTASYFANLPKPDVYKRQPWVVSLSAVLFGPAVMQWMMLLYVTSGKHSVC